MASQRRLGQAAKQLGYTESSGYIEAGSFDTLPPNALRYGCRRAAETSGLRGVYLLKNEDGRNHVPIVFLCEAETEEKARDIHRRIWNLNLVPFLVIETPTRIRVYPGFSYEADDTKDLAFTEASLVGTTDVLNRLAAFHADAIDDGRLFAQWGHKVTPKTRVDEHLLRQLKLLDVSLRNLGLHREPSHCLIGKYVWLSYLKDRGILSDWRINKFDVSKEDVFSRHAKLTAFHHLDDQLQAWLNGEIFPLRGEDRRAVKSEHLQKVAGIFAGDEANGQMALFTDLYDFSYLPIETLSVVYEQFLHYKEEDEETSEGEESGAYYTPVCLADFMIAEMEMKRPLRDGVAVFDPSCGSGAFLVQAYRRLIERTMHEKGRALKLTELRNLLEDNIFGVDRDPDACHVARMSLAIALLDYANPPDISGLASKFKLPTLSEKNILQKDFFELDTSWPRGRDKQKPQWIIGNPPWVELKTSKRDKDKRNAPAWAWFDANKAKKTDARPVSGNQIAEAFVWRVLDFAREDSLIGLVLPAMTLFKHEAQKFRQGFFSKMAVWCVANFANFMEVLFAGRARQPAACFFYQPKGEDGRDGDVTIATFAPIVAEQRANRPLKPGQQLDTWNILVRAQDWREINPTEAAQGERLTWKLAMWGSDREKRLMQRLRRFPKFADWAAGWDLIFAEGPQLCRGPGERLKFQKSLVGKRRISFRSLRGAGELFSFPPAALSKPLEESECYIPHQASIRGVDVCESPVLVLEATRRLAVFSKDALIVPTRRAAVHGKDPAVLKALALYLMSPFAQWHQFFTSSQWGISVSIATIDDLERLPIALPSIKNEDINSLAEIYDQLVLASQALFQDTSALISKAQNQILRLLNLRPHERDLIDGFFVGPWQYLQGKFPTDAVQFADKNDIDKYCYTLRRELDAFLHERGVRHQINIALDERQVLITIEGKCTADAIEPLIREANSGESRFIKEITVRLRKKHSQWVYFEKSLYLFEKGRILFLKPRYKIEWNVRQAVLDADDLIAETLSGNN